MRIRVSYVVEVDEWWRRAIRAYYGQEGLATRDEVKSWCETFGDTMNGELSEIAQGMGLFDE